MIEGWKKVQVSDICTKGSSNIAQNKIEDNFGEYPLYGASGFLKKIDFYHQEKPYIGIVKDGSGVGRVGFYPAKSSLLGTLQYILPKEGYDIRFVGYALKSLDLASFSTGAAIPHIYFKDYGKSFICVPPTLEEQERVVNELDLLTGIIDKKSAQLRDFDALTQSIFYEMFGDPIANDKRWGMKKVIEVVKMQRGFDLPVQDRVSTGRIPVYGSNGIVGMHSQSKVSEGIITGRSGTIGRVDCCRNPFWPLNTTLFSIDCRGNNIIYLKYLMSNFHLERFSAGAGVPTLNRNDFHEEPIIDVPLEMQVSFASKVEAIENYKSIIRQSLTENQLLLDSRMNAYFN